ncbi:hypothetical protein QS1_3242, partial [Clostridioides difficile P11]
MTKLNKNEIKGDLKMYNEDYKKLIKSNYKITMISIKNN